MSDEIADSDEESDFEIQHSARNQPEADTEQSLADLADAAIDVNFDDFISQTQSLSRHSADETPPGITKRGTGSTQRLLNNAHDAQRDLAGSSSGKITEQVRSRDGTTMASPTVSGRKRRHTEVEGGVVPPGRDRENTGGARRKRVKTYGGSSRQPTSSQDLETNSPATERRMASHLSVGNQHRRNAPLTSEQASSNQNEEDVFSRRRNRPRVTARLVEDVGPNGRQVYTSESSMGNYQSLNIGPDMNPFGPASQISTDDFPELPEHNGQSYSSYLEGDLSSTLPLTGLQNDQQQDEAYKSTEKNRLTHSTMGRSRSIDSSLNFNPPSDTQMLTPQISVSSKKRSTSYHHGFADEESFKKFPKDVDSPLPGTESRYTAEPSTTSKKRGRNFKNSGNSSIAPTQGGIDDLDINSEELSIGPKEQYKPRASKSRGDTHDPESQDAEHEEQPVTKKKGRKKSLMATVTQMDVSSPTKLPTSELNLSDEAIIGFPKEKYNPRPSRSRRGAPTEQAPAAAQSEYQHEEINTKAAEDSASTKVQKAKKAKMKRAKTTVVAKKSEPMLSDGEDDVVWVEERPAKVQLKVPIDLSPPSEALKRETVEEAVENAAIETSQRLSISKAREVATESKDETPALTKITVEIPQVKEQLSEQKKKDRKRKKTAEVVNEDEEAEILPENQRRASQAQRTSSSQSIVSRPALTDKTSNTNLPPPSINDDDSDSKATAATPSPAKPLPNDRSPTSGKPSPPKKQAHSPINPAGGKALYRVGLSRRTPIPSLLKMVRKPEAKAAPVQNDDAIQQTMKKWREAGVLD